MSDNSHELEHVERQLSEIEQELSTATSAVFTAKKQIEQQQAQIQLLTKFLGFALQAKQWDWDWESEHGALLITEEELGGARSVVAEFTPGEQMWRVSLAAPKVDPSLIQ